MECSSAPELSSVLDLSSGLDLSSSLDLSKILVDLSSALDQLRTMHVCPTGIDACAYEERLA